MKNVLISTCLLGVGCRYDGRRVKKIDLEVVEKLKKKFNLIPFCPEIYGGLPTPRIPSERVGDKVLNKSGADVTKEYMQGAEEALHICNLFQIDLAILKERSPACGKGRIYDGTFSGTLVDGDGVACEYLMRHGVRVIGESEIEKLLNE